MSAKQDHPKPTTHFQDLPDDVLCEVFRHLTWIPYGIDPSDMAIVPENCNLWSTGFDLWSSQARKRDLVRVCKSWYNLTALYFYEWIIVRRMKGLRALVSSVERTLPGNTKATFGWGTKRVDIILCDFSQSPERFEVEGLLFRLLYALPYLKILVVHNTWAAKELESTMSKPICPNLRIVKWNDDSPLPRSVWQDFISHHPHLEFINPTIELRGIASSGTDNTHNPPSLSNIKVYSTRLLDSPLSTPFTHLEYLSLTVLGINEQGNWNSWLPVYFQPNLHTLQLNIYNATWDYLSQLLSQLYPYSKNSQNLCYIKLGFNILPKHRWNTVPSLPSSVKCFTISALPTSLAREREVSEIELLLQHLSELVKRNKVLVVEILDNIIMTVIALFQGHFRRCYLDQKKDILLSWLDENGKEIRLLDNDLASWLRNQCWV